MRPAFSVIFLTTLIGAGQGLFLALVAGQYFWVVGAVETYEASDFYVTGSLMAFGLLAAGLLSSFFHLAHPERAWRAASQWRTSWLSREVILLPAVMVMVLVYAFLHWMAWDPVLITFQNKKALSLTLAAGYLGGGLAALLFVCTGMIYACMRFIQEWATPLTVLNFGLMGTASGFIIAAAYAGAMERPLVDFYAGAALTLTVLAFLGRVASVWRNRYIKHLTDVQSAIGVHHRNLRQLTRGFTASAFNLKEFFHPGGPGLPMALTVFYMPVAFVVPAVLITLGWRDGGVMWFVAAFVLQYIGLIAERWVFFAEARHPQNLYYQKVA